MVGKVDPVLKQNLAKVLISVSQRDARALTEAYRKTLHVVFRRPAIGILIGVTLPVLGFWQAQNLPEQFFPPADRDQIQIEVELVEKLSSAIREESEFAEFLQPVLHSFERDLGNG